MNSKQFKELKDYISDTFFHLGMIILLVTSLILWELTTSIDYIFAMIFISGAWILVVASNWVKGGKE